MKTIAIAAAKGGVCKTTITTLLAVRAMQESMKVAMLDLNEDQGNLSGWWTLRGEPMNPRLIEVEDAFGKTMKRISAEGYDWCFLDTPPTDMDVIEACVMMGDAVIIPVRTSIFDIQAAVAVVEMCQQHDKPFAFVLAAVDTRSNFKPLIASAINALVIHGPVLATRISYQMHYINAATKGKTGPEIDKKLKDEVDGLWGEVNRLSSISRMDVMRQKFANGKAVHP